MNVFQKNACLLGLVMKQMLSDGGGNELSNLHGRIHVSCYSVQPQNETLWSMKIGDVACENKDPGQSGVWNRSQQATAESGPVACLDLK